MSSEIKNLEGLKRNIKISINEARYQQEFQQQMTIYAKQSPVQKGFRKGKMSPQAVEQMLSKNEKEKIMREIIIREFIEQCNKEKITPATLPNKFQLPTLIAGAPIECSIDFEIMPEFTLKDVSNIKLEKLKASVDDTALNLALNNLQQQFTTWTEKSADSTAEKGDQAIIDFLGTTEAGEFPGGKAEDFEIELGAGQMIAGFEDGIYGMKIGDKKDVAVTFPEPYHAAELAGKPASFAITLKKLNSKQLPEINDEFAVKAGIAEGGLEKLKLEMTSQLEKQLEKSIFTKLKESALKELRSENPVELPESLIDADIEHAQQMTLQRIAQQTGHKAPADIPLERDLFLEGAKERVHTGLLISKIITTNNIQSDQTDMQNKLNDIAASYNDPQQVIEYYSKNKEALEQLHHSILEDKAVEWVIENASVNEKEVSFSEATTLDAENTKKS